MQHNIKPGKLFFDIKSQQLVEIIRIYEFCYGKIAHILGYSSIILGGVEQFVGIIPLRTDIIKEYIDSGRFVYIGNL